MASSQADFSAAQHAVTFAYINKLRLAIKASGHDFLGRSTAKNSLLISTALLRNISFTENFQIKAKNGAQVSMGSAVTVGSGVPLSMIYQAAKDKGKIVVGGSASTVVAAGGYFQGAGHSPLGPLLGLAVDNLLGT